MIEDNREADPGLLTPALIIFHLKSMNHWIPERRQRGNRKQADCVFGAPQLSVLFPVMSEVTRQRIMWEISMVQALHVQVVYITLSAFYWSEHCHMASSNSQRMVI